MKKQFLILAFAFAGLSASSQNNSLPTFFNKGAKFNQPATHGNALMGKANTFYMPGKQIDFNWDVNSTAWIPSDTTVNTYNSTGKVVNLLRYFTGGGSVKNVYIYNPANGKETSDTTYSWNGTVYSAYQFNALTYDVNGNLTKVLGQNWSNNTWVNANESDYTYDANGNQLTDIEYYTWTGTKWVSGSKYNYTFTGGQMTEEIDQNWDTLTNTFINLNKTDFTYTSGKLSGGTAYKWNGTTWIANQNIINVVWYQWNGNLNNSKMGSYTSQFPNGSGWKDSLRITFTYDSHGNTIDNLREAKPTTTWITSSEYKFIYQYDANNNITQQIEQDWVDATTGVRNSYRSDFSNYQGFTSTGITQINSSKNDFVIYPNPSNGIIYLQTSNECKIDVYNIVGEKVYQSAIINHQSAIDLSMQPKGIYFIQLSDGNSVVNKKVVVQ